MYLLKCGYFNRHKCLLIKYIDYMIKIHLNRRKYDIYKVKLRLPKTYKVKSRLSETWRTFPTFSLAFMPRMLKAGRR